MDYSYPFIKQLYRDAKIFAGHSPTLLLPAEKILAWLVKPHGRSFRTNDMISPEFKQAGWSFLPSVFAYHLPNQKPELKCLLPPMAPSLLLTGLLCFDFRQAEPVGWWNWLEEVEMVLIWVPHLAAEVAICAPHSWQTLLISLTQKHTHKKALCAHRSRWSLIQHSLSLNSHSSSALVAHLCATLWQGCHDLPDHSPKYQQKQTTNSWDITLFAL